MIIGISGRKQAGKTTLADYLVAKLDAGLTPTSSFSFADRLKDVVWEFWIQPIADDYADWNNDKFKNTKHPCGLTYRELLQKVGTDWFRQLWPEVWLENLSFYMWKYGPSGHFIIPDVRFPNEVKWIQDKGGKVLRLTRTPFPDDTHESETALDFAQNVSLYPEGFVYTESCKYPVEFDHTLCNGSCTEAEKNAAALPIITEWIEGAKE